MRDKKKVVFTDDHTGCFGKFNIDDTICRQYCILSLRCAIEYDQNSRSALLDEFFSSEIFYERIQ
jgi:hypothetical protein